jgi:hypothetical protein
MISLISVALSEFQCPRDSCCERTIYQDSAGRALSLTKHQDSNVRLKGARAFGYHYIKVGR